MSESSKKKKILFVIPILTLGGAERIVSNLSYAFPKDYELEVLLNSISNSDFSFNGNVICMGMQSGIKQTLLYQIRAFMLRVRYLKKLRRKNDYEAVISFSDSANVANVLTRRYSGKTILSVHTYISAWKSFAYKCIVGPLAKLFYNKSDKIVAVAREIEKDLVNTYKILPDKVITINNGFEIDSSVLNKQRMKGPFSKFRFITVGSLQEAKGTWHLIRAFSNVKKIYENVELVILGEGILREYLERLVRDYKLNDDVTLRGFVLNVKAELSASDCFVMSSMYEGFPMALCEAISCGLPAVCSDFISGSRDIIAPGYDGEPLFDKYMEAEYGILAPKCSGIHYEALDPLEVQEIALANAMVEMITNNSLREKYCEISKESIERFSISECAKQWLNVIQE